MILSLCLVGCKKDVAQTIQAQYVKEDGASETVEMKLASNLDVVSYLLYVPSTWFVNESDASTVAFVSRENKTSVSVAQWNLTKTMTTIDLWWSELHKKELEATMPAFTVIEEGIPLTVADSEAKKYVYSVTFESGTYMYEVVAVLAQGSIHVITYTSTPTLYNENIHLFENLILPNFDFV